MEKRYSYATVFTASFCLMVLELIAGRLVAPFVGVSIYTWTSIIGVVLIGITLGNWAGGRLADRAPREKTLGWIFIAASFAAVMIVFVVNPLWRGIVNSSAPLELNVALRSLLTFFPVAFMLSFVTPLVIKLRLRNLDLTGRTVGSIYGWSAAGSIAGTFLTGFWLVAKFGTFKIVWGVFAILALAGFLFLLRGGPINKFKIIIIALVAVPMAAFGFVKDSVCQFESQYYCVRIGQETRSGAVGYALILDALDHGYILPQDVDPFGYDTFRLFAMLVNYKFPDSSPDAGESPASGEESKSGFKVLVVGGGAYVLPRYLLNTYPDAEITVFEIDPKVTEINYSELGLERDDRLRIFHGDGRFLMNRLAGDEKFDFIFIDAFSDFLVPHHLATKEFVSLAKSRLRNGGIYFMHLIDSYEHGRFLSSNLLTIGSVFENTYFFPMSGGWEQIDRSTLVVVGAESEIDGERWEAAFPVNDPLWPKASEYARRALKQFVPLSDSRLARYISDTDGLVLTDSYAPVENMLAPLFADQ